MSLGTFPDIWGPSTVAPNSGTPVVVRGKKLNILSLGATAVDNPSKRRTDLTVPDSPWNVVSASRSTTGEWLPGPSSTYVDAGLFRANPSVTGVILTGLDSAGTDPTEITKFIGNVGTQAMTLQPPASPIAGKQYLAPGSPAYTLDVGATVRIVWDTVSLVYRIKAAGAVTSSYLTLDGARLTIDGNPILNPEV